MTMQKQNNKNVKIFMDFQECLLNGMEMKCSSIDDDTFTMNGDGWEDIPDPFIGKSSQ